MSVILPNNLRGERENTDNTYVCTSHETTRTVSLVPQQIRTKRDPFAASALRVGQVAVLDQQARGGAQLRDQDGLTVPVLKEELASG